MAHNLEIVDGNALMAYRLSKGEPWHGLGVPVSDDMSPADMMKAAGLDWRVQKVDTFVDLNGRRIKTGQQALIRETDGKILTHVGAGWNPVQNEEAFEFFADFVSNGDMVMDTAGSLAEGRIVWAAADVKDGFTLFGGDEVKGYLLFSNPHQYGKSIDVKFVMTRVVCNNTLSVALTEKGQPAIRVSHRNIFNAEKVKELLGISHRRVEKFKEAAELLGSKKYTNYDFERFLVKVFGGSSRQDKTMSRTAERAFEIVETQPGAEYRPGTWWNAYGAVTYLTDHELGRSADNRATSAWFGYNAKRKLDALNTAVEMAEAA